MFARFIRRGKVRGKVHGQQSHFRPEPRAQALVKCREPRGRLAIVLEGRQLPDQALVLQECESDPGKRERCQGQIMLNVRALGFFAPQKLAAGRQIVEQLAHLDARSRRVAGGFHFRDFSPVQDDLRGLGRTGVAFTGRQREPADAGDARQRFTAKAHRRNGLQILRSLDFAGGVSFQAKQRVVPAHPHAVVRDANQAAAASLDFHRDAARLRVERVFDQFLDHTGGALDHFAGGDLVGDLFGQQANAVHAALI